MEQKTLELMVLMFLMTCVDTLTYTVRLNAVKSGQFALSSSLFNIFVLVTRTANNLLLPAVGALADVSIVHHVNPIWNFRQIVFAATIGACVGGLLVPTFVRVFAVALRRLETVGSIPVLLMQSLSVQNIKRIGKEATLPNRGSFRSVRFRQIPKTFLLLNIIVTGVYTISLLAVNYAGTMVSVDHRLAVVNASGAISGVATILLTLLVDPKSAMITDQAMRGQRPYGDVKALVVMLIGTKILGTLFGQLIFVPAAVIVAHIYG
jgi:hypothetical protein